MIYLLHFDQRVAQGHTTQHYLGYTDELQARLNAHKHGHGARLTEVAFERGIGFSVARIWTGDRTDEKRLKSYKNAPRYCPFCTDRPQSPNGLKEIDNACNV